VVDTIRASEGPETTAGINTSAVRKVQSPAPVAGVRTSGGHAAGLDRKVLTFIYRSTTANFLASHLRPTFLSVPN